MSEHFKQAWAGIWRNASDSFLHVEGFATKPEADEWCDTMRAQTKNPNDIIRSEPIILWPGEYKNMARGPLLHATEKQ